MPKVTLEGYILVPNEDLALVLQDLPQHIRNTQSESGCLIFNVEQQKDNPNKFIVYEEFINKEAFEFHQERVRNSQWGKATRNVQRHYQIQDAS